MKSNAFTKLKNTVEKVFGIRAKKARRLIVESGLFDWQFFVKQANLNINSELEAAAYYLTHSALWRLKVSEDFDGGWYLTNYKDVQRSAINPLLHFIEHGAREGRIPVQNLALPYERHLWAGLEDIMVPKLSKLVEEKDTSSIEKSYALWALARWFVWQNESNKAIACLRQFNKLNIAFPSHQGPTLQLIVLLIEGGHYDEANRLIEIAKEKFPNSNDLSLLRSNLIFKRNSSSHDARLDNINDIYRKYKLPIIMMCDKNLPLSLSNVSSDEHPIYESEKTVSVIVPSYNASQFIERALNSLLAQTWSKLEVIVVDDASTDGTSVTVKNWIKENRKFFGEKVFTIEQKAENTGAYASRNLGMSKASGHYLTVHDADDFSHSCKIEQQVRQLEAQHAKASVSHWVRCDDSLVFERWRIEDALIYRNVSSLMVKRDVFVDLGYWDQVRFGADTEYYERIITYYGESAIVEVLPGVPLSFGLSDNSSLTQTKSSHLKTQFAGVRKDYMCSARLWHKSNTQELFLSKDEKIRKFPVSDLLLSSSQTNVKATHIEDLLRYSPYWSEGWYVRRNKPIQELYVDPVEHFVQTGMSLGFEFGPKLSLSYLQNYKHLSTESVLSVNSEDTELGDFPPFVSGFGERKNTSILISGHAANKTLFGAELSLVDMVKAASNNGFNVIVVLPSAENKSYIDSLKPYCSRVYFVNDTWWQKGISRSSEVIVQFLQIFEKEDIALLHVNTLVQHNIYEAAYLKNIPVITHVRELLSADSVLRETLCATSSEAYTRILDNSQKVIANSTKTKEDIVASSANEGRTIPNIEVVPNIFEVPKHHEFSDSKKMKTTIRFGLVSSNIAKKGVEDAILLADALESQGEVNAKVVLVGPKTDLIKQLEEEQSKGLHTLVIYKGYVEQPQDIYENLDVVLNLSHFSESFGRTVLEGMAYGRPSLCYDNGALSELVDHGYTGFLVPFRDHSCLVKYATKLIKDKTLYAKFSEHATAKAKANYSMSSYQSALSKIYQDVLMRSELDN